MDLYEQQQNTGQDSDIPDILDAQLPDSMIIVDHGTSFRKNIQKQKKEGSENITEKQSPIQGLNNFSKSRERIERLTREQEYLSETFKIGNFYNQHKLNIQNLKNKISQIKPRQTKLNESALQKQSDEKFKNTRYSRIPHKQALIPLNRKLVASKNYNSHHKHNSFYDIEKVDSHRSHNYSTMAQKSTARSSQKNNHFIREKDSDLNDLESRKTGFEFITLPETKMQRRQGKTQATMAPKIQSIGRRRKQFNPEVSKNMQSREFHQKRYGTVFENYNSQKGQTSPKQTSNNFINSRLQPIAKKNIIKIQISQDESLEIFQRNVLDIWSLHENLTAIVQFLSPSDGRKAVSDQIELVDSKFIDLLLRYKKLVCSPKYQFLMPILKNCIQGRQIKVLIQSRLLENLSIVYIFFHIAERFLQGTKVQIRQKNKRKIQLSHLVNFVGICSRNLLLVLRVVTLTHNIAKSIILPSNIYEIFDAIENFEKQSYSEGLSSLKETLLRIEHNNQLSLIIQSKLNYKLKDKQLHSKCISEFLRGVVIDGLRGYYKNVGSQTEEVRTEKQMKNQYKPLFEYSYYIFEYLAYHLHVQQCIGLFPEEIQTAPAPYLPLSIYPSLDDSIKQFTLVINPKGVLLYEPNKQQKIYIRAHTQYFLRKMLDKCNIILWSDEIPHEVDSYFDLLTNPHPDHRIYKLYQHHCIYAFKNIQSKAKGKLKYRREVEENQLVMIKDISRISLQNGKYLIIDGRSDNYFDHEKHNIINMEWRGAPWDNGLKILADHLQPILREGINLAMGVNLMRARLQTSLKTDKNNRSIDKKRKKH